MDSLASSRGFAHHCYIGARRAKDACTSMIGMEVRPGTEESLRDVHKLRLTTARPCWDPGPMLTVPLRTT